MISLNLKRLVKKSLLKCIVYNDISPIATSEVTFYDLSPGILHAFARLDSVREMEGLSSKNYYLTLKKYWSRYERLPCTFKIDANDQYYCNVYLEDEVYTRLVEIFNVNIDGRLDKYKLKSFKDKRLSDYF